MFHCESDLFKTSNIYSTVVVKTAHRCSSPLSMWILVQSVDSPPTPVMFTTYEMKSLQYLGLETQAQNFQIIM